VNAGGVSESTTGEADAPQDDVYGQLVSLVRARNFPWESDLKLNDHFVAHVEGRVTGISEKQRGNDKVYRIHDVEVVAVLPERGKSR
jgi:hypothetical protein